MHWHEKNSTRVKWVRAASAATEKFLELGRWDPLTVRSTGVLYSNLPSPEIIKDLV